MRSYYTILSSGRMLNATGRVISNVVFARQRSSELADHFERLDVEMLLVTAKWFVCWYLETLPIEVGRNYTPLSLSMHRDDDQCSQETNFFFRLSCASGIRYFSKDRKSFSASRSRSFCRTRRVFWFASPF